jgi:S-adenosylmethionine decarboxylase
MQNALKKDALPQAQVKLPGLHLIGDLYDCRCDPRRLIDKDWLEQRSVELVMEAGLTAVGHVFHAFGDAGGVTGMVVLAESHLSLHTWPEDGYVTLDVYVCNYSTDNRDKARRLFDALVAEFQPGNPHYHVIDRA